jgi:hypothetical protein
MKIVTVSHWNFNGDVTSSTEVARCENDEDLVARFESLVIHFIISATEKIIYTWQMISLIAREEYANICQH